MVLVGNSLVSIDFFESRAYCVIEIVRGRYMYRQIDEKSKFNLAPQGIEMEIDVWKQKIAANEVKVPPASSIGSICATSNV